MAANPRSAHRNRRPNQQPDRNTVDSRPRVDDTEQVTEADAQEIEAEGQYVTALLCDEEVRVIPPGAWRQSWQRHLGQGRIDAFAELVIHPDDLAVYEDIDPTNDEFGAFVADAGEQAGESLGKSRGPSRSQRRTRRR
ncbi:hypothetical protein ABZV65_19320 [Streptomyces bauhiniae]|uniref:hypothetical protein n=1 Tax=Streptomyces bauhiniae TaxID=2340725 RepID=UPI0033B871E4